jgi:nicotinamidase-related amidase
MKNNALLIIDMQNDFVLPNHPLTVDGAIDDAKRLTHFIVENMTKIDYISATLDSHNAIDISHPCFWSDKMGNFPAPFTGIQSDFFEDVKKGIYTPRFWPKESITYLENLAKQGEFKHTIWPEHCLIGSEGAAIVKDVHDVLMQWERTKQDWVEWVFKGTNPLTEHYGAFRANIERPGASETQMNDQLLKTLNEYTNVYFAGEASSHCVANTLKQAMDYIPELAKKFVILTDCMSPVKGCEHLADSIYNKAKSIGIRFAKSTDITL